MDNNIYSDGIGEGQAPTHIRIDGEMIPFPSNHEVVALIEQNKIMHECLHEYRHIAIQEFGRPETVRYAAKEALEKCRSMKTQPNKDE